MHPVLKAFTLIWTSDDPVQWCIYIEGILPKGPYLPCESMAGRALLAGYHRYVELGGNEWKACPIAKTLGWHPFGIKVHLQGRQQAARMARDLLWRDLLHGNSVYMVRSCRARFLHIIRVSTVSEVGGLQENCSQQPVPRSNFKFKLKLPPGLTPVAHLLRAACCRVNAPVVFLWFYFAGRMSCCSRVACPVLGKHSFNQTFCFKSIPSLTEGLYYPGYF